MRQRNQREGLKGRQQSVSKRPQKPVSSGKAKEISFGTGVSVFDEDGDWTGMMMMNIPIQAKSAVVWIIPLFDEIGT